MSVRTDLSVDWNQSPRIVTIADPSTEITIQDLHDTLRAIEDAVDGHPFDPLVDSAGKESLGAGKAVGITLTLQNARLAFAARPGPTYVQCVVSGGNFVAVDSLNAAINPVEPTAFTQVVVEQSTSPTLVTSGSGVTAQDKTDIITGVWADVSGAQVVAALDVPVSTRSTQSKPQRGVALPNLSFVMFASATRSPTAGFSVAGQLSQDGGAFAPLTNTVTEIGGGVYTVSITAAEMTADVIVLLFTATTAEPSIITLVTAAP